MTVSETLRLASEALQQVSVALAATAQTMEDAPGPAPAPEPEPGEWRNDRAPGGCISDTDANGKVWAWDNDHRLTAKIYWRSVCNLMEVHNQRCFWAPGNRPAPKSPPPPFVASKEEVPAPQPEEWRSMPAPSENDVGSDGKVWVWHPRQFAVRLFWRNASYFMLLDKSVHWAPGNQPLPTLPPLVSMTDGHGAKLGPPPDVVASQEVEPQPDASPESGTPRTGGWIVDRVPDAKDSSDEARGLVRIPQRPGTPQRPPGDPLLTCHWSAVQLGQPWAPIGYRVDPWDPTCLDRNGWIRSRLPIVEDTGSTGHVLIPVGHGGTTSTITYHLIVPGQPWAPWGSNPGVFEK